MELKNSMENEKLLKTLNSSQKEAVTTTEGPLLILAGAGTGKTHTMVSRLAYLVNSGVHPKRILMLTFTNKAANEMKKRAKDMAGDACEEITACTYHSFCNILLRKYGDIIGLDRKFSILSTAQAEEAMRYVKSVNEAFINIKDFPKPKELLKFHSCSINKEAPLDELIENSEFRPYIEEIKEVLKLYDDYKKEKNFLDFDDLLLYANKLLENSTEIQEKIEKTYQYIMVDEYQDSNNLQTKMLFLLRRENKNLAVVGDDAQSIYGFRGANVENIRRFPERFQNCKIIKLTENYRSTQKILDLANKSYEVNSSEGFSKTMHGQKEGTIKPVLFRPYYAQEATSQVAQEIIRIHREENVPFRDIAILARFSSLLFGLEVELNRLGYEYEKYGGKKFMEIECVLDMIAILRITQNPKDDLSYFRTLALLPGIGEVTARKIAQESETPNFLIADKYKRRKYYKYLEELNEFIGALREMPATNVEEIFNEIYKYYFALRTETVEIGNFKKQSNKDLAFELIEKDKEAIEGLRSLVEQHDSIQDFLDSLILEQTPEENTDDKIILSTIHSAKGLEFDTVFLLGCLDGVFPSTQAKLDSRDFNEELRCFYVAITRPKRRLYMVAEEFDEMRGEYYQKTSFLRGCREYYREIGSLKNIEREEEPVKLQEVIKPPQNSRKDSFRNSPKNSRKEQAKEDTTPEKPRKINKSQKRNNRPNKPQAFSFKRFFKNSVRNYFKG